MYVGNVDFGIGLPWLLIGTMIYLSLLMRLYELYCYKVVCYKVDINIFF